MLIMSSSVLIAHKVQKQKSSRHQTLSSACSAIAIAAAAFAAAFAAVFAASASRQSRVRSLCNSYSKRVATQRAAVTPAGAGQATHLCVGVWLLPPRLAHALPLCNRAHCF